MPRFDGARERIADYARMARMDRPIGTLLLMWPTLWGLWSAGRGRPDPYVVLVLIAGVFLMRSAGCVINDFADRGMDGHVARTRDRPLAAGRVTAAEALAVFVLLCLAAFALVLTLNALTIWLSVAGLVLAAVYPFVKRFTHLPQLFLGVAFSWGIPMAFAAQTDGVPAMAWWWVGCNILWVLAYDTMYAMVDRADDLKIGVKSTAILFGKWDRAAVAGCQALVILVLLVIAKMLNTNVYFYGGVGAAVLFAGYQQWLIRDRDPAACFKAFLNNAWFGAAIFVGLVLSYL